MHFGYLNGALIRWNDFSEVTKRKIISLYRNFENPPYQATYYSFNIHHGIVMYLNGDIRRFGIRQ